MSPPPVTTLRSVALLERAIGYTRSALSLVQEHLLDDPTPCEDWDLRALLEHMDDSLAAFTEAAAVGRVDLEPLRHAPDAVRLVGSLRLRACDALGAWTNTDGDEPVLVGATPLDASVLAAVGALEIAVHGWDVCRACGVDQPIPPSLAEALLGVAVDVVGGGDRTERFGPARQTDSADPAERLLAFLGR
jgi:uncharacterized protein (TIGR03086 family)